MSESTDPRLPEVTEFVEPVQVESASHQTEHYGSFKNLIIDAVRSAVYMRPRWANVPASPNLLALLIVGNVFVSLILGRLAIPGPANFYLPALANGWLPTLIGVWICYLMRPASSTHPLIDGPSRGEQLLAVVIAQSAVLNVLLGGSYVAVMRAGWYDPSSANITLQWVAFVTPQLWLLGAPLLLIWRGGSRHKLAMFVAALLMLGGQTLAYYSQPPQFWYAQEITADTNKPERKEFTLTQERMEAQPALLAQKLDEILPQRPKHIDLYTITFAPYSNDDVFHNETAMVSEVMASRFDAKGRGVQLVNHVDTMDTLPWATGLNLQRAIAHMGALMDKDEDILFLHLSSHGASDGHLSASFDPMEVEELTPADLNKWLDQAGIKNRVISISACYSGTWVAPLANDNTLVMTASDADHTSYGCGKKSALTFFGRAIYDEQLRSQTLSFEAAHAAARPIIKQREEAEKKEDGYSNPQIKAGIKIRERLARLQQQIEANAKLK